MRNFIAALLLGIGSQGAWAETKAEWTEVVRTYNPIAYADFTSLQRSGDNATLWVLVDYQKVPFDGNNLPYQSLKMHVEYDCKVAQFRFLKLASYAGRMASGNKPYTADEVGKWQPIADHGIQKSLWDKVCLKPTNKPVKQG